MKKIFPIAILCLISGLLTGFAKRLPAPSSNFRPDTSSSTYRGGSNSLGSCLSVNVDCANHRIHIAGANMSAADQVIDCGKNGTTKNGQGTIGGLHNGRVVKDGVRIEGIIGMGDSGGGRVFHTAWWKPGQMATGANDSKGCIHVSPNVLRLLKSCKGAKLTITGGTTRSRFNNNNRPKAKSRR